MLKVSISKNSLLLTAFAIIAATLLALTYENTKDQIAESEREAAQKALLEIIPVERIDNDLLLDTLAIPESAYESLGKPDGNIHLARKNGDVIGVIVPAIAPDGYSGAIKMLVGVNSNGTIAGVRVLSHKETPSLGDKIDIKKSQWITSFDDKSLQNPQASKWKVKKDGGEFDQFTGATITPRAVTNAVHKVLVFVEKKHSLLFEKRNSKTQK